MAAASLLFTSRPDTGSQEEALARVDRTVSQPADTVKL
jgi:hypothetical protein